MDRVLKSTPSTASVSFYDDGVIVDPGAVTVTITALSGATLAGGAASGTGATARTFALTTTHTASLDELTLTWVSATKGTLTTTVEVVGGFLCAISEIKALPGLSTATTAQVLTVRVRAEQILERRLGIAFVPRYRRETRTGDGGTSLMPSMPKVRSIRSITIDGTALTASELAALTVGPYLITGRTWRGNIVVGYEHGWDAPEEPVRQAVLALARFYLTAGPGQEGVDPRVAYITTPEGRINYGTNGLGLPEVENAIQFYDMNTGIA